MNARIWRLTLELAYREDMSSTRQATHARAELCIAATAACASLFSLLLDCSLSLFARLMSHLQRLQATVAQAICRLPRPRDFETAQPKPRLLSLSLPLSRARLERGG